MATAPPTIADLPTPPTTSNPASFDANADAFVAALPDFVDQANELAENVFDNAIDGASQASAALASALAADAARVAAQAAAAAAAVAAGAAIPTGNGQLFKTEGAANVRTAAFTGATGRTYDCNTTAAAFTGTLHAAPSVGDLETFSDFAGTFGINPLTIGRNGQLIAGVAEDFVCDIDNLTVTMVFVGGTKGWAPQ